MKVLIATNLELRIVDTLGILEKHESNEHKINEALECLNLVLSQTQFGIAAKLVISENTVIIQVDR